MLSNRPPLLAKSQNWVGAGPKTHTCWARLFNKEKKCQSIIKGQKKIEPNSA